MRKIFLTIALSVVTNFGYTSSANALKYKFAVDSGALIGFSGCAIKDKTAADAKSIANKYGCAGIKIPRHPFANVISSEKKKETMESKSKFTCYGFVNLKFLEETIGSDKVELGLFTSFGIFNLKAEQSQTLSKSTFETSAIDMWIGPNISYKIGKFGASVFVGGVIFKSKYLIQTTNIPAAQSGIAPGLALKWKKLQHASFSLSATSLVFGAALMSSYDITEKLSVVGAFRFIPRGKIAYESSDEIVFGKDANVCARLFEFCLGLQYKVLQ